MRYVHPDQTDVLDIASAVQQARAGSRVATILATVKKSQTEEIRKM